MLVIGLSAVPDAIDGIAPINIFATTLPVDRPGVNIPNTVP